MEEKPYGKVWMSMSKGKRFGGVIRRRAMELQKHEKTPTPTINLSRSGGSFPLVDRKYASTPIAHPQATRNNKHTAKPAMKTLSITSCVSGGMSFVQ